jgi:hypothetical protein
VCEPPQAVTQEMQPYCVVVPDDWPVLGAVVVPDEPWSVVPVEPVEPDCSVVLPDVPLVDPSCF